MKNHRRNTAGGMSMITVGFYDALTSEYQPVSNQPILWPGGLDVVPQNYEGEIVIGALLPLTGWCDLGVRPCLCRSLRP